MKNSIFFLNYKCAIFDELYLNYYIFKHENISTHFPAPMTLHNQKSRLVCWYLPFSFKSFFMWCTNSSSNWKKVFFFPLLVDFYFILFLSLCQIDLTISNANNHRISFTANSWRALSPPGDRTIKDKHICIES